MEFSASSIICTQYNNLFEELDAYFTLIQTQRQQGCAKLRWENTQRPQSTPQASFYFFFKNWEIFNVLHEITYYVRKVNYGLVVGSTITADR
jgi:hypothetical protein